MIGQGSPSSSASRFARVWLIAGLFAAIAPCALGQDRPLEPPVRMRIAWGGQEARRWTGRIALDGGKFSDLQLLGMDADAAGSIWLESGEIRVASIHAHRFDGLFVTATADTGARLRIELSADGVTAPAKFEVPLSTALREEYRQPLDGSRSELIVQRAPNDELRIETERDTLIFAPGDKFTFQVTLALEDLEASTTIDMTTTLATARDESPLPWSDEQRLTVPVTGRPTAKVQVPVPMEEGVYAVRVRIAHPPGMRKAFLPIGGVKPIAERTFQIVVLRPVPGAAPAADEWVPVLEIDPASPRWWQRLPAWTQVERLPGFMPRPLGSLRAGTIHHPLGQFVELPPTVSGNEPHWQAYPLPIEQTGVPYELEVEYPADAEQHLGLSILEPNAAGRIVPVGRDSGVYVEGLGRVEQTSRHRHRLIFWPRTQSPLLLVTNRHPSAAARFGRIRVLRGVNNLSGPAQRLPWREAQRLVAAYMARPLVPELFGASEGLDADSGESVDDWETHLSASRRLADYLRFAGYNAAVLSVLADGSSLYPSRQLLPTPLYDTSRTVTGAKDLPASDPLEVLLQVFDREGLALVPALQLAAPLPELERLRRGTPGQTSGLEWVGWDGRTWLQANGTNRGLAPYYNLLDERVQQAILNVAREIVDRYGHHAALAGLAVQLSGDGYAQLPGVEWGFDDATIARFERETGIHIADGGPNRFAARHAALVGPHLDTWRSWRTSRVTSFYGRLAKLLQSDGRERRLLLTTEEMFAAPRQTAQLRPNLLTKSRVDELLQDVGIDCESLEQMDHVTVCAVQFVAPTAPLVDRATDFAINDYFSARQWTGGALLFHRPNRLRLASFDAKSGLNSHALLVTQSSADMAAARKGLVKLLTEHDPTLIVNGGELLPMGQERASRDILRVLQHLPTRASVAVQRQQPVFVRTYAEPSGTTCLVLNESPWSVDADVMLDLPTHAELEVLCPSTADPSAELQTRRRFASGRQTWPVHLEPYGICAARWSAAGVHVAEISATMSEAARAELQTQLTELAGRDLTKASKYDKLTNPGFEPTGGNDLLPGWRVVAAQADGTAELDATRPVTGTSCLYLHSRSGPLAVESNSFATPPTGQLAMTVWVRAENLHPQSELRVVLEAERGGQPQRMYWTLGGPGRGTQPLGSEWNRPFAFGTNELPLDSQGRMRVRFELTGPGDVWIDEIQMYDVLFSLPFYKFTQQETLEFVKLIHAASSAYELNRVADCVNWLEGYWPRFLMAYTPMVEPAMVHEAPPAAPQATSPPDEPTTSPSRLGRMKDWLLNPFR